MTTSQRVQTSSNPAPWRKDFKTHIDSLPMPTFVLATTDVSKQYPRARTCVYRGLWSSLPPNERNPAPRNPDTFESDMPVFTTDARMEKSRELCSPPLGKGNNKDNGEIPGTGGGGAVEAVYWAPEHGTQWRVRGEAYLLGPDVDDSNSDQSKEVKRILRSMMRRRRDHLDSAADSDEEKEWSFSREITAHFGNLSPGMRGTFRQPPPGQPLAQNPPPEDGHLGLGKKVEDVQDPVARRHFRVVVIVPSEVDRTDLSDPERPRRWIYTYHPANDQWHVVEVWP